MIDYFKSYTVQLDRFKILFRFNNELENRLFLLDRTQTTSMFKVADLVGGELFEFQERPLSLYDNFSREIEIDPFGTKYVYRDMSSILKMKDTNRLKFTDNCIISIIE